MLIKERKEFSEEFKLIKRDKDYDITRIRKVIDIFRRVNGHSARFQEIDELIKNNLTSI